MPSNDISANLHDLTVVVDDNRVHYNLSQEELQPSPPSSNVLSFIDQATGKAWNDTLTVITAPSVSFWYNFTGYTRVAVFGSVYTWAGVPYTPWANFSINGEYIAGNISAATSVVTDYPLFVSNELPPGKLYNLTVEVSASSTAPFVLDYVMGFQQAVPTSISGGSVNGDPTVPNPNSNAGGGGGSSKSSFPVGTVVGPVVSVMGLIILALAGLLYYFLRHPKRRTKWTIDEKSHSRDSPEPAYLSSSPSTLPAPIPFTATSPSSSAYNEFGASRSMSLSYAPEPTLTPNRTMSSISVPGHARSPSAQPLLLSFSGSPTPPRSTYGYGYGCGYPGAGDSMSMTTYPGPTLHNPYDGSSYTPSGARPYTSHMHSDSVVSSSSAGPSSSQGQAPEREQEQEYGPHGFPKDRKRRLATQQQEQEQRRVVVNADAEADGSQAASGPSAPGTGARECPPPAYGA